MSDSEKQTTVVEVRAMPAPGHQYRWCGAELWANPADERQRTVGVHALPWPARPIRVAVVDSPERFDPNRQDVPTEISPRTLEALQRDPRISVRFVSLGGADPDDLVRETQEAKLALTRAADKIGRLEETRDDLIRKLLAAERRAEIAEKRAARVDELEVAVAELSEPVE